MSSVVLSGDTSGAITLSAPSVAGTNTITLPASTGTVMVSGNMPAFGASGASTACSTATSTLIGNSSLTFDTNSCYNNTGSTTTLNGISAPAYSFTPNVGGYYQFNAIIFINGSASDRPGIFLYKNGSAYYAAYSNGIATSGGGSYQISGVIYLNGTSDYVQLYYLQYSGSTLTTNNSFTFFNGAMIRRT